MKDYYTNVLCENKAKPNLHCEGKCKLAKEIKKDKDQSEKPNSLLKIEKIISNLDNYASLLPVPASITLIKNNFPNLFSQKIKGFNQLIYHPPII